MNMKEAVISGYRKSFQKRGRATRSEFWYFSLWFLILEVIGQVFHQLLMADARTGHASLPLPLLLVGMVFSLFMLLTTYPLVAVQIRRLHDVGRSGWWVGASLFVSAATELTAAWETVAAIKAGALPLFLRSLAAGDHAGLLVGLVAVIALGITVFIFTVLPSEPRENAYGPNPLGNTR